MKLPYQEGTLFAVPLLRGGYAVGVVARTSSRGVMLNYFFGPARRTVPKAEELTELRPPSALKVLRVGDLHLLEKTWPIIGQIHGWKREEWPMPPFVRRTEIMKRAWKVQYPDNDANGLPSEKVIDYSQAAEFESDSVYGAGAAEIVLTNLLTPRTS